MPRYLSPALISPPAKCASNFNPSLTRISVPIEHGEAVQQLLWWLWLAALIEVTRSHHDGFCCKVAEAAFTSDNMILSTFH